MFLLILVDFDSVSYYTGWQLQYVAFDVSVQNKAKNKYFFTLYSTCNLKTVDLYYTKT